MALAKLSEIDVALEGVKGAKSFFEAKVKTCVSPQIVKCVENNDTKWILFYYLIYLNKIKYLSWPWNVAIVMGFTNVGEFFSLQKLHTSVMR